ncbi:hypothetical protein AGRO_2592 [Agrobacterium sp. ATCC 31749]|nr:hypothetical protein AGRO_2592 [Agrobacterium sp. ATCC 31749]
MSQTIRVFMLPVTVRQVHTIAQAALYRFTRSQDIYRENPIIGLGYSKH